METRISVTERMSGGVYNASYLTDGEEQRCEAFYEKLTAELQAYGNDVEFYIHVRPPSDERVLDILREHLPRKMKTILMVDASSAAVDFIESLDSANVENLCLESTTSQASERIETLIDGLAPQLISFDQTGVPIRYRGVFDKLTSLTLHMSDYHTPFNVFGTRLMNLRVTGSVGDELIELVERNQDLQSVILQEITPCLMECMGRLRNLRKLEIRKIDESTREIVIDFLKNKPYTSRAPGVYDLVDMDDSPQTWADVNAVVRHRGAVALDIDFCRGEQRQPLYSGPNVDFEYMGVRHAHTQRDLDVRTIVMLLHGHSTRSEMWKRRSSLRILPRSVIRHTYDFFKTIDDVGASRGWESDDDSI